MKVSLSEREMLSFIGLGVVAFIATSAYVVRAFPDEGLPANCAVIEGGRSYGFTGYEIPGVPYRVAWGSAFPSPDDQVRYCPRDGERPERVYWPRYMGGLDKPAS